MALTVGDILDFLRDWERSDRFVINFPGPDVFLYVPSDHLTIGSGQGGASGDEVVVEIAWEPPPRQAD